MVSIQQRNDTNLWDQAAGRCVRERMGPYHDETCLEDWMKVVKVERRDETKSGLKKLRRLVQYRRRRDERRRGEMV